LSSKISLVEAVEIVRQRLLYDIESCCKAYGVDECKNVDRCIELKGSRPDIEISYLPTGSQITVFKPTGSVGVASKHSVYIHIKNRRMAIIRRLKIDKYVVGRAEKLYPESFHFGATRILFLHDWLKDGDKILRSSMDAYGATKKLSSMVRRVLERYASYMESKGVSGALNFENIGSTPLAYRVIQALRSFQRTGKGYTNIGARINVTSTLGAGKTTFVFWSCVSALLSVGLSLEEALKVTKTLFVKDLEELLQFLEESIDVVRKNGFIPFLVLDDAVASGLSKYETVPSYSTDPVLRKVIAKLNNLLTISREGLGAFVVIGHINMLPKPLREYNVDLTIEGVSITRFSRAYTLWVSKMPVTTTSSGSMRYRAVDITGTIVPILRVPDDIYAELEAIKIEKRIAMLEDLVSMYKEISSDKEKKSSESKDGNESKEDEDFVQRVSEIGQLEEVM